MWIKKVPFGKPHQCKMPDLRLEVETSSVGRYYPGPGSIWQCDNSACRKQFVLTPYARAWALSLASQQDMFKIFGEEVVWVEMSEG